MSESESESRSKLCSTSSASELDKGGGTSMGWKFVNHAQTQNDLIKHTDH